MADASLYVNLISQVLQNDDTLGGLVDCVVPGFRRSAADQYLAGPKQACIGIRNLQILSESLPGCYFHGGTIEDQLVEIHVISIGTDDAAANAIVERIKDLLKGGLYCTYNAISYRVLVLRLNFAPLDGGNSSDAGLSSGAGPDRVEIIGTVRLKYLDS